MYRIKTMVPANLLMRGDVLDIMGGVTPVEGLTIDSILDIGELRVEGYVSVDSTVKWRVTFEQEELVPVLRYVS